MLEPIRWKNKALGALANMAVVKFQLTRLSVGRRTHRRCRRCALVGQQLAAQCQTRRYRKWMAGARGHACVTRGHAARRGIRRAAAAPIQGVHAVA